MNRFITQSIPQQLYRPEQVRETEGRAAELAGLSMWQLMDRAGRAVFECLHAEYPVPQRVLVLCGSGNNGGDGYVVAKLASLAGYSVRVCAVKAPTTADSQRAQQEWHQQGGQTESLSDWQDVEADVVIDALLGTGLTSDVRGEIAEVIDALNESGIPVLAVDVPSGLNADSGRVLGCAVTATHTITMVAAKRGMFTGQAGDYCGKHWFADLGILREFRALNEASVWRLDASQLQHAFSKRPWNSHKGMFGHVLVIGGSDGMAGAARLTGLAALRAGAGKVSVICQPGQQSLVGLQPELMVRGLDAGDQAADELLAEADVIAVGPGLGQGSWGQAWWQKVADYDAPMVVDADALNWLAKSANRREDWVLTPHPGEAARLLQCSGSEVEADRWLAATRLEEQFGGIVVLKGAGSIVHGQEYTAVNTTGNPGLASAGMGDTLTGIIAALLAPLFSHSMQLRQNLAETVGYAVLLHGSAADEAAQAAPRGMLASDLMDAIRKQVNTDDD
ncbi:NAD(P)H-hydrate dehydratase [Aliidiomarina soli]|uniref:NAD(P)H-hydrate dehydratase n=1 Tax=Aliidiomarina soli TaxID=1928574 RepID=UPI0018E4FE5C|nr:NAD(P)H-hydrate dehydratase [Aliidiomarina soli]